MLFRSSSSNTNQCLLGIFGQDQNDPDGNPVAIVRCLYLLDPIPRELTVLIQIGGLFLKAVYSVYSYSQNGAPAVGFATSITSDTGSASSSSSGGSSGSSGGSSAGSSSAFHATGIASVAAAPIASAVPYTTPSAAATASQVFSAASGGSASASAVPTVGGAASVAT